MKNNLISFLLIVLLALEIAMNEIFFAGAYNIEVCTTLLTAAIFLFMCFRKSHRITSLLILLASLSVLLFIIYRPKYTVYDAVDEVAKLDKKVQLTETVEDEDEFFSSDLYLIESLQHAYYFDPHTGQITEL